MVWVDVKFPQIKITTFIFAKWNPWKNVKKGIYVYDFLSCFPVKKSLTFSVEPLGMKQIKKIMKQS